MDSLYLAKRHKGEHKGRKHGGGGMKCRRRRPDDDEKNGRRNVGERMVFPVEWNEEGHRNWMLRGGVIWRGRNEAEVRINGGDRMINNGNCMKPQLCDKEVINGGGGTTVLTAATTTTRQQQQNWRNQRRWWNDLNNSRNNNTTTTKSKKSTEVEEWL